MLTGIISFVITIIFLLKMIFQDISGTDNTIDAVKQGIKNAKEIDEALKEAGEEDSSPFKK